MSTKEIDNPAGRLLRILEQGEPDKIKRMPSRIAWGQILDTDPNNTTLLVKKIGQVIGLFDDIRGTVQTLTSIDPEHLVTWIPKFFGPWSEVNLSVQFSHYMSPVDAATLSLLRITDSMLSRQGAEPTVHQGRLDSLLKSIRQLAVELSSADVSEALKHYLRRYLVLMENAVSDYRICGYSALRDGLERCLGHYALNRDLAPAASEETLGKKVLGLLATYTLLVTAAVATLQLPHEIEQYLSKHSESATVQHANNVELGK